MLVTACSTGLTDLQLFVLVHIEEEYQENMVVTNSACILCHVIVKNAIKE